MNLLGQTNNNFQIGWSAAILVRRWAAVRSCVEFSLLSLCEQLNCRFEHSKVVGEYSFVDG